MKDITVHLLNAAILGGSVFLGSLTPLLTNSFSWNNFIIGSCAGFIAGLIIFLNKINEWIKLKDPDPNTPMIFNFVSSL